MRLVLSVGFGRPTPTSKYTQADPCGILAKGYRFVVRGPEADGSPPWKIRPVDVTDVAAIYSLVSRFNAYRTKET